MRRLLLALLLATPTLVSAQSDYRDYATGDVIDFTLYKADGTEYKSDATFEAGDCKIMIDEGNEANCANLPIDEGTGYSLTLSTAEVTGKRVVVYIKDQTVPKAWIDRGLKVETAGNASSQHPTATTATTNYRSVTR